jgi:2-keto-4-pentenoate hydratase/2-oxohepta-3-ene-1,7-dioic acid hydratase in catechol pathway
MKIARFHDDQGNVIWGSPCGAGVADELTGDFEQGWRLTGRRVSCGQLLCPVEPRAIVCIGLNYRAHAAETGQPIPQRPVVFMKNPASVQHPHQPIRLPRALVERPEADYEGELALVVGRTLPAGSTTSPAEVLSHVAGYTVANDVSARRLQKRGGQWVRGKSLDTFCPLGPVLVTADEVPDPQQLAITTRLNGEIMQQSNTADMIFSVAELLSDLSREMTLLAGTVLLTGTPAGVGFARRPPVYLSPGDLLEVEIEGIGLLRNPVESAAY